jgi:hypothetical protein
VARFNHIELNVPTGTLAEDARPEHARVGAPVVIDD